MKKVGLVVPALASVVLLGCEKEPDTEATGYVGSLVDTFRPRQLVVWFEDGTPESDMEAVVQATGSTVISHAPGSTHYLIETPLGYCLQEIHDEIESDLRVTVCMPNLLM